MKNKNLNNGKMDERQIKLFNKALSVAAIFAYIYEIIVLIYKYYKTKDISSIYLEMIMLSAMVIGAVIYYIISSKSHKEVKKNKGRKFFRKPDEREKQLLIGALAISGAIAILHGIFVMFLKLFFEKSLESAYTEITLVATMSIIIIIYNFKKKEYDIPKSIFGRTLPASSSKEDKRARNKNYLLDASILSLIFLGIDISRNNPVILFSSIFESKILSYGANFIFHLVFFLVLNYLWGEYNIRKYNSYYDSLQDED